MKNKNSLGFPAASPASRFEHYGEHKNPPSLTEPFPRCSVDKRKYKRKDKPEGSVEFFLPSIMVVTRGGRASSGVQFVRRCIAEASDIALKVVRHGQRVNGRIEGLNQVVRVNVCIAAAGFQTSDRQLIVSTARFIKFVGRFSREIARPSSCHRVLLHRDNDEGRGTSGRNKLSCD